MTFRVFIGSTGELAEYRDVARDVCEAVGMQPIRMEAFNATGLGATAASLRKLDDADVYVVIVGWRYGHVEEGRTRSVTAEEHRYAGERRIERLCFLTDPKHDWPLHHVDVDRRHIEEFRKLVEREVRAYFSTADNFRAKLTAALAEWKERHGGQPASSERRVGTAADGAETNRLRTLTVVCEEFSLRLLLDCYRGALGDWVPIDDLTTARRIVERLADTAFDPRDVPPILRFAILLEHHSRTDHDLLPRWIRGAAVHHDLDQEVVDALRAGVASRTARNDIEDRIVVRLDDHFVATPSAGLGPERGRPHYLLRATVQHGDGPSSPLPADDDRVYSLDEVRGVVVRSVREWTRHCRIDQLSVEFLVPTELLGEPFDQWLVDEPGGVDSTPLGVLFGVSVRDVTSADRPPSTTLRNRWRQLNSSRDPVGVLRWIPATVARQSPLRAMLLRDSGRWACLVFERFVGDDVAHRLLAIAVEMDAPVILWVRAAEEQEELVVCELREHLAATPLPHLPTKLLDLRRDAVLLDELTPHCGRHVGLLWDDPERRPHPPGPLQAPR